MSRIVLHCELIQFLEEYSNELKTKNMMGIKAILDSLFPTFAP